MKSLKERAIEFLSKKHKKKKIDVIGDIILDKYIFGEVNRICPEAPVPVLDKTQKEEYRAGGMLNVVNNIQSLSNKEADLSCSGIRGLDANGDIISRLAQETGAKVMMYGTNLAPTTTKTRFMAGTQQLLRVDEEKLEWTYSEIPLIEDSVIVIADYHKGFLCEKRIRDAIKLAKISIVDPNSKTNADWYSGATYITPNLKEAEVLSGLDHSRCSLFTIATGICVKYGIANVLITLGKDGMYGFDRFNNGQHGFKLPSVAKQVYDVSGAGDTVVAALGLYLSEGADFELAAYLANIAASVVVSKVGTATCSKEELLKALDSL